MFTLDDGVNAAQNGTAVLDLSSIPVGGLYDISINVSDGIDMTGVSLQSWLIADKKVVTISQNVDPEIIKEINYGIINHLLEFQYLHPSFINFSENNLIIKQDIPMHMGTLRFNDEWRDEKKRRFIEVD